uniref:protein SOSEKI 5-like n=1 Tax=Erigeron canadensis TaxID=72917 RepID=UPI001CB8BE90|nr:protein SOSEKI 5-like [Erigeron canadensis]
MSSDSRKTTPEMFIPRSRPKKNRNRVNVATNRDTMITNSTPDSSPIVVKHNMSPEVVITPRKVPVLYYLAQNGHIEHPHLIDVPLSSPHGLYLRDVMNTLNYHRGKGMANMFSWSVKRSYKNGYVWHDLSEDDLVEATNGHDYVLKGSELLQTNPTETTLSADHEENSTTAAAMIRRRNQSWSSFDNPQEYMVVKCESNRELAAKFAADAATQTDEQRRRQSFELGRKEPVTMGSEEMPSPPPSNSSSEVSEGVSGQREVDQQQDDSGRMKASRVLMQLIACGAPSRLKMQTG